MPDTQNQPSGDDKASSKSLAEGTNESLPSILTQNHEQAATQVAKHWMKIYRTGIASGTSSIVAVVVSYPLDSIKTRLQAQRYKHLTECVQQAYKEEGLKGFWRGAVSPVFSVTAVRMTSFSIYQKAKYKYSAAIGRVTGGDEPLKVVNVPGSTPTPATIACFGAAGATSGMFSTVLACPLELTKVSAQISNLSSHTSSMTDPLNNPVKMSYQHKGTFKTAKNIVLHRGFAGMYSGFGLHLLRDTLGSMIYFTTYESTKQLIVKFQGSNSPTSPLSVAMAGGFCGLASWFFIYPIDTAKTRYQRNCLSKAKGEKATMTKIDYFKRSEYRGMGVSMARSCLVNTIFFSAFELIKKKINQLPDPGYDPVE